MPADIFKRVYTYTFNLINGKLAPMKTQSLAPNKAKLYKYSAHWWKTIGWQYIALQHIFSRLIGAFTRIQCPMIKNWQIRTFIKHYGVDIKEALIEDYREYKTFNDFFTRALKANARPIDNHARSIISPADGILSQFGAITNSTLIQAKGKTFNIQALLGYDNKNQKQHNSHDIAKLISPFSTGYFATVYLAPKNYHRIHMPVTGTLKAMRFIPGALFSVSTHTANHIDNLFARNERLVCFFDTEFGPLAVILVGAMLVSSMETTWAGVVRSKTGSIEHIDYTNPITIEKGEELGRFNMGSTVILLMSKNMSNSNSTDDFHTNDFQWNSVFEPANNNTTDNASPSDYSNSTTSSDSNAVIQMGQLLGQFK